MSNVDDKFSYTWQGIGKDFKEGWSDPSWEQKKQDTKEDLFDVNLPSNPADDLDRAYQNISSDIGDSVSSLGDNALRALSGATSLVELALNPIAIVEDASILGSAVVGATQDYLQDKWKAFVEKYILSTTTVTVKSLVEDVGALTLSIFADDDLKKKYGYDTSKNGKIWDKVVSKLDDVAAMILGVQPGEDWGDLAENLFKDYASSVSSNDQFLETVSSMQVVKGYMETLQGVMDGVQDIIDILKALEPVMPIVEIAVAWAGVLLNPPSATDAANKTAALTQETIDKALQYAIVLLKKYVFSIEVKLPTLLVSSMNTVGLNNNFGFGSLDDMIQTSLEQLGWVEESDTNNISGVDSFTDINAEWTKKAIKDLENSKAKARQWQNFDFNGNAEGSGIWKKNNFLSQGVDKIMSSIANKASSIAGSLDIDFRYNEETGDMEMYVDGILTDYNDYYHPHMSSYIPSSFEDDTTSSDDTSSSEDTIADSSDQDLSDNLTDADLIDISGKILGNL